MDLFTGAMVGLALGSAVTWVVLLLRGRRQLDERLTAERRSLDEERLNIVRGAAEEAAATLRQQRQSLEEAVAAERELLAGERAQIAKRQEQLDRVEDQIGRRERALADREQALVERQASCDRREAKTLVQEEELARARQELASARAALDERSGEIEERLMAIARLTPDEARAAVLERLDEELAAEQSRLIARRRQDAENRAREEAVEIVTRAIQRYAGEHTVETTTNRVEIADEEMKGRIIGKEGRNIRAFEQLSGVDVIIDDTPGIITLSCFDGIRREIARRALEELLEDGRIHPSRIEEVLAKVRQDLDRQVMKAGEDAAFATEVSGLHPQVLKLLGKLKYRTSYGQNVLQHVQEVAWLCGAMAADMGLDPKLGRRCGLLHDLGKALDHEHEGSHPVLGYEALKRFGESEVVANAALAHHEGYEAISPYTVLTAAADAISAARPGARRENVERYIKRLQQLEDIACDFPGVSKAYAIQAGRELRVIVDDHSVSDDVLPKTARSIARRIEEEVAYPGEVRVTLIRERRATAVAR